MSGLVNSMIFNKNVKLLFYGCLALILCGVIVYFGLPNVYSNVNYRSDDLIAKEDIIVKNDIKAVESVEIEKTPEIIPVSHIKTPDKVKALYMSSWVAGSPTFRNSLVKIIDETELNAIVIDIKDSTGRVSFHTTNQMIKEIGSSENRISNIRNLTGSLHSKNIYIIGRISVFQDPYLAKLKPEWAITRKDDGKVWKDNKGLSFLDPTNKNVQGYVLALARYSYDEGFDEINFDYIRYPSDGNISNINYKLKEGQTRTDNIESFFKYLSTEIKKDINIPISADLFGLTTEVNNDMGIGQVWEKALPYFDFLSPMVYPSHYPTGHDGYKNPALYPYEVIDKAIKSAIIKTEAINQDINKIRPWLQDFDLGATYTKEMVKAEMKAVYDNGLDSWMLWDPSNKYTPSALSLETN